LRNRCPRPEITHRTNLDYKHLMNVSRIGKVIDKPVPTDEEIWA
jgi:hypothetical protein